MGSWKLGRIAGIDISLHWSLLLLVAWVVLSAPAGGALGQVTLVAALFGCVLLHELGHAMAARQFGIRTHGITLLLFGGIAALERMPRRPLQELWIAVAGPLVNLVIAGGLFLMMAPLGSLAAIGIMPPALAASAQYLMFVNIGLALFNMLPAFPMDGGRVLRAMLALRYPYLQATEFAANTGKFVALGLGVLGLLSGQLMLMIIAGFVVFAGGAEARMVANEQRQAQGFGSFADWRAPDAVPRRPHPGSVIVVWDAQERRYRVVGAQQ